MHKKNNKSRLPHVFYTHNSHIRTSIRKERCIRHLICKNINDDDSSFRSPSSNTVNISFLNLVRYLCSSPVKGGEFTTRFQKSRFLCQSPYPSLLGTNFMNTIFITKAGYGSVNFTYRIQYPPSRLKGAF